MTGNLILTIHRGEPIEIDGPCQVTFIGFETGGDRIKVAFEAEKSVSILRKAAKVRHG